jgi:EEF1A lysine methyltransferase 4
MPADFDKQEYWHSRFAKETRFEWLATSDEFMRILEADRDFSRLLLLQQQQQQQQPGQLAEDPRPGPPPRILHIGFGTSDLQNHLRAAGLGSVLNVDYEPLAVERGRALEEARFGDVRMGYAVADATRLDAGALMRELKLSKGEGEHRQEQDSGEGEKFSLVIDKSTADAVSCGGDEAVLSMCHGVRGCLGRTGFWISLSYSGSRFDIEGLPFRCEVIARVPTVKLRETDPDVYHYCYKLTPWG